MAAILAIDQGTTGTTCLVFDERAELIGRAAREFAQHFPRPGLGRARRRGDLGGHPGGGRRGARRRRRRAGRARRGRESPTSARPSASGIPRPASRFTARSSGRTGARPRAATSCAQRATSRSSASAPDWCSTRTSRPPRSSGCCENVDGLRERAEQRPGGVRDRRRVADLQAHAASGRPIPRTPPGRCCSTSTPATGTRSCSSCSASRSARCPELRPSCGVIGTTRADALHGHAVPVAGIAGDQQAALFGQACIDPGLGKNTYGTGSFVLQNAGYKPPAAGAGLARHGRLGDRRAADLRARGGDLRHRRRGAVAARRPGDHRERRPRPRQLAASLDGNDGVYFVPALTGLGSPHWDPYARGHDRRADPRAPPRPTWPARRSRRSPTRRSTPCGRWRPRAAIELTRAARRRRRHRQRLADAVPGRRARRAGRASPRSRETTALGAAYLAGVGSGAVDARPGALELAASAGATSRR